MLKKLCLVGFIAGTLLTLLLLAGWQVQRLQWKNKLIADYEAAQLETPVPVTSFSLDELQAMQYRPVSVTGVFHHDKEVHLGARRYYGKNGYHILTPFTLEDGRNVLVNRGWVPSAVKDPAKRVHDPKPESLTQHRAMVRLPKSAGIFTPDNHPEKNFWFTVDIPAIEKFTELELLPFSVELVKPDHPRAEFPAPSDGRVVLRNDHLGYAITWFALAFAAAFIFFLRLRKGK